MRPVVLSKNIVVHAEIKLKLAKKMLKLTMDMESKSPHEPQKQIWCR